MSVQDEFRAYVSTRPGLADLASMDFERVERAFLAGWEAMAREHRRVIRELQQDAYREMRGEPYERAFLAGWEAMAREHRRVIRDAARSDRRL